MNVQERNQLLAEKTSLERMIMCLPESSAIDRMSLQARKEKVEKELKMNKWDTNPQWEENWPGTQPELIAYDSLIDLIVDLTEDCLWRWEQIRKETGLPEERCKEMESQISQVLKIFDKRRK